MYILYIVQCNDVLMALFQLTNRNPNIPCNEILSQNLHYKNRYYVMNQNLWSLPFYNCHSPSYTMSNLYIYTRMNQAYFCKNFHGLDTHCSILVPCIRQYRHIDHSLSEKKRKVTHESWVMIHMQQILNQILVYLITRRTATFLWAVGTWIIIYNTIALTIDSTMIVNCSWEKAPLACTAVWS